MKRILLVILLLAVVAISGYAISPSFRSAADAVLPEGARTRLAVLSGSSSGQKSDGTAAPSASRNSTKPEAKAGRASAPAAVTAAVATRADMPVLKFAIGYIESPAVVSVNSRVTSQVVAQHVTDGQMVKAGDLLFTLDDRALRAQLAKDQATLAKDQAQQASAAANLERAQALFKQGTTARQALDQAIADEKTASANIAADNATIEADQLQISYTRITAPIAGKLGAIQVHPGDLVNSGGGSGSTPLVAITQISPIRVSFAAQSSDLPALRQAMDSGAAPAVQVFAPGDYGGADSRPLATGKLDFIDSSVDTASGNVVLKASFANQDGGLWPGEYVNVVLEAGTMQDLTAIPTVAVQQGQDGPYVFVVGSDGKVQMRQVKIALSQGDQTGLSSGLAPGERVVTEGQLKLKDGAPVTVKETKSSAATASSGFAAARIPAGSAARS